MTEVTLLLEPAVVLFYKRIADSLGIPLETVLADALFKIQIAIDAKCFGIGMRWMILSLAFLTAIAGVLVLFPPWQSPNVLTVLLGIFLLEEGH